MWNLATVLMTYKVMLVTNGNIIIMSTSLVATLWQLDLIVAALAPSQLSNPKMMLKLKCPYQCNDNL